MWFNSFNVQSPTYGVEAQVLVHLDNNYDDGLVVYVQSLIKDSDGDNRFLLEKIRPEYYDQGREIIGSFSSDMALRFVERQIKLNDVFPEDES